jgi:hypothetical protein
VVSATRWSPSKYLTSFSSNEPPESHDITIEASGKDRHYFSRYDISFRDGDNTKVLVHDGAGSGADIDYVQSGGVIQSLTINSGGSDYSENATAEFLHPTATNASVDLTIVDGVITGYTSLVGGTGYLPFETLGGIYIESLPSYGVIRDRNAALAVGDVVSDIENLSYQRTNGSVEEDSFLFRVEDTRSGRSYHAYTVTVESIVEYERYLLDTLFAATQSQT